MAAEKNKLLFLCQLLGDGLAEHASLGRGVDDAGAFSQLRTQVLEGPVHRPRLHDHAGPAAVGGVVHVVVLIL